MLKRAASCFHPLSVLAWDIAVTEKGPVVIEANTNPSLIVTQMANDEGLLATPLGGRARRFAGRLGRCGTLTDKGISRRAPSTDERRVGDEGVSQCYNRWWS